MDSIGTNITTALDVVRQIDEQAARMVQRIEALEKINREQDNMLAGLHHHVEQMDAENNRLNEIIDERNEQIAVQAESIEILRKHLADARAQLQVALDNAEAKPTDRDEAWAISQSFADGLQRDLTDGAHLPLPKRAADAAYLIRQLGEHKRPVRFAQYDQQVVLHCAEIVAAACAAL